MINDNVTHHGVRKEYVNMYTCVCMYVCMYVCVCVCVCVYIVELLSIPNPEWLTQPKEKA